MKGTEYLIGWLGVLVLVLVMVYEVRCWERWQGVVSSNIDILTSCLCYSSATTMLLLSWFLLTTKDVDDADCIIVYW